MIRRSLPAVGLAIGGVGLLVLLLWLWEQKSSAGSSASFFFSSPSAVVAALSRAVTTGQVWTDLAASAQATVYGLSIGTLVGGCAGLFGLSIPRLKGALIGLVAVVAALPILALAPMFMIWFGVGIALKVALAALLSGLVVAAQTLTSMRAISPELEQFMSANRITRAAAIRLIVVPLAAPAALHRFPDAVNAAFLGVFVGEFIAADRGIGYRILRSGSLYAIDQVLAYTVVALLLLVGLQVVVAVSRSLIVQAIRRGSIDPRIR